MGSIKKNSKLVISGDIEKIKSLPIVFMPDGILFDAQGKGIIFSCKKDIFVDRKVITGEGIVLPNKYNILKPQGYDNFTFAAVLYERCNKKSWGIWFLRNFVLEAKKYLNLMCLACYAVLDKYRLHSI